MRILGIDPGYAIVGYGVIEAGGGRYRPVEYGAITTPAGQDFGQRLVEIYQGMGEILTRLKPEAAAVEKLYFTNNKTTGIGVAEARGVILLALAQHGVPLYEYTPMQVKQAVTGYGKAVKPQVQEMTRRLLGLQKVPQPIPPTPWPWPSAMARQREAPCGRRCSSGAISRRRSYKSETGRRAQRA